ncbi:MAG TPA: alpha-hydroxy acid oxidase [Candidatus Acidoferrum sp.]|nr:alpha-hydroxy acid oxidase [Candidatus Acidoferrum sp.]
MSHTPDQSRTRRKFLKMLGASPLIAGSGVLSGGLANLLHAAPNEEKPFLSWLETLQQSDDVISSPDQALDVMDFEPAARKAIPPAHWGYLATGVDDDATVRANRDGYSHIQIRSRRLVDVTNIDMSRSIFGVKWNTPIALSPVGGQKAFHPDGELGVARAARAKGNLMLLSSAGTASIEDAIGARGGPVWQQLYPTNVWEVCRAIVKRAEAAGAPAIVLTVDLHDGSNREALFRAQRVDKRQCSLCHTGSYSPFARGKPGTSESSAGASKSGFAGFAARKPMFDGLDVSKVTNLFPTDVNWDFVKRLRDTVTVKFLIKGIVTREDAQLAVEHGVDGLIVSNHGGRAEETLRPTIESLPEVLEGVGGKVPVIVDGGVRRGTDIFKALALGATAVGIGRPHSWGLGAFGQAGVEAVLEILQRESRTIMRQAGTTSVDKITRDYLVLHPS